MTTHITANLPARNFDATQAFYARLGFEMVYRGDNWMILSWQGRWVEFFPHPDLDPKDSWFSACIRAPEIDALYAKWSALDWDHTPGGFPNIGAPIELGGDAPRMFTIGDPDGSLWRVLEMGQPSQP